MQMLTQRKQLHWDWTKENCKGGSLKWKKGILDTDEVMSQYQLQK